MIFYWRSGQFCWDGAFLADYIYRAPNERDCTAAWVHRWPRSLKRDVAINLALPN
jgi:hypothetical protein